MGGVWGAIWQGLGYRNLKNVSYNLRHSELRLHRGLYISRYSSSENLTTC
jgi:hypothetical protein